MWRVAAAMIGLLACGQPATPPAAPASAPRQPIVSAHRVPAPAPVPATTASSYLCEPEILPPVAPTERLPAPVAIALVIDLSLDRDHLAQAVEAARATIDVLDGDDLVTVVGADRMAKIVTPLTVVWLKARAHDDLAELTPVAHADLTAGLARARRLLHPANAKVKHIILLTGGWGESDCLDAVVAAALADGITVSTIGIGHANRALLDRIVPPRP